jgi:molybdopterin-binding protein
VSTHDASNLLEERSASRIVGSRNRLPGRVVAVRKDVLVAEVEMACGPYRVVSLMSRDAADELDLKPGDEATAVVKAATVFIQPADQR